MNKPKEQDESYNTVTCHVNVQMEDERRCQICGFQTYPQGSCHICPNCGTSTGCS